MQLLGLRDHLVTLALRRLHGTRKHHKLANKLAGTNGVAGTLTDASLTHERVHLRRGLAQRGQGFLRLLLTLQSIIYRLVEGVVLLRQYVRLQPSLALVGSDLGSLDATLS